jgi:hypothetical protein
MNRLSSSATAGSGAVLVVPLLPLSRPMARSWQIEDNDGHSEHVADGHDAANALLRIYSGALPPTGKATPRGGLCTVARLSTAGSR